MKSRQRPNDKMGHIGSHCSSCAKLITVLTSLSLLIGLAGCAETEYRKFVPSEELRAKLGTVGIVFLKNIPESSFPAKETEKIEAAITNAISALKIQESMSEHVLRASSELVDYRFYPEPFLSEDKANYALMKERGIDTVLEMFVGRVGFEGESGKESTMAPWFESESGKDPVMALVINIRERLIRTSDNAVLYERKFTYRSPKRRLSQWAEDNSKLMLKDFERAYQCLAEKVIEETFLRYDVPRHPMNVEIWWR